MVILTPQKCGGIRDNFVKRANQIFFGWLFLLWHSLLVQISSFKLTPLNPTNFPKTLPSPHAQFLPFS